MTSTSSLLDNIAVVLKKPKYAENIGAAARTCFNMGISELILVRDEYPSYEDMAKMATHKAVHLIDQMQVHEELSQALAPFGFVIGIFSRTLRLKVLRPLMFEKTLFPLAGPH